MGPAEAVARIDPAILVVWPRSRFSKGVSLLLQGDKALIYRPKHVVICFRVLGKPRITWSRQGAYFQHFFHHFCGIYGIYPAFLDSHCRPFRHPAGWWCFDVASQRQVRRIKWWQVIAAEQIRMSLREPQNGTLMMFQYDVMINFDIQQVFNH